MSRGDDFLTAPALAVGFKKQRHHDLSKATAEEVLREIFGDIRLPNKNAPAWHTFDVTVNVETLRRVKELVR